MSILKYIKIILVLLFKAYLVYLWINSVETFTQLLYYIYVLKVSSLEQFGLFLFFLFGNICCILWLVLWCKRLPPAFNKPKIYYETKDWIRSKKQEAPIYKVLFGSLLLLLKLCLVVYILITISTVLSIPLINDQSSSKFKHTKKTSYYLISSLFFIYSFIYLYNMVLIVSYISSQYNKSSQRGWDTLFH